MENNICGYCGYSEKKAENQHVYEDQIPRTPSPIQPQAAPHTQTVCNMGITPGVSRKSKITALLLCIFFGYLGAHKFYVGKTGMGILYLFTLGIFGFGWLIDIIIIATGSFRDEFDLPLRQ